MDNNLNIVFKTLYGIAILIWIVKTSNIMCFYYLIVPCWKKTTGTIVESNTIFFRSKNDSDNEGWQEAIIYTYNVDGRSYENNVITKNLQVLVPFKKNVSRNFDPGESVIITYDPKKPSDSVIEDKFNFLTLLGPALFYIVVYFLLF